jgi:hypothetical protein
MKTLIAALVLAGVVASPAFARPTGWLDRPVVDQNGQLHISAARAAALRECSAIAAQYPEYEWGNMEIQQYRACMAERGQVE